MKRQIEVLLVDDHEVVRQGLRRILESAEDIKIVGDCSNAQEAFAQIIELCPDIVLMGTQMPGMNGIEATRHLKKNGMNSDLDVIILAESVDYAVDALEAGASGYLLKDTRGTELAEVIRQVCLNESMRQKHDNPVEERVDLVLPPSTDAAQTMKFVDQVEKQLHASIMQTVGSPDSGAVITIMLEHDTALNLLDKLREIPDVETAEESSLARDSISNRVAKVWDRLSSRASCSERILVTLN
ncbi:MAG: response regulator transcription factor [Chloroflexi bacterium]|nr:response regulator transcription factor [Chloroflexota bacterium]